MHVLDSDRHFHVLSIFSLFRLISFTVFPKALNHSFVRLVAFANGLATNRRSARTPVDQNVSQKRSLTKTQNENFHSRDLIPTVACPDSGTMRFDDALGVFPFL